jgi:hypothetical protein
MLKCSFVEIYNEQFKDLLLNQLWQNRRTAKFKSENQRVEEYFVVCERDSNNSWNLWYFKYSINNRNGIEDETL